MANVCIQVRVGKSEANEKGREYKFSFGDENSKISNDVLMDIIEEGIFKELKSKFGELYEI